jgi:pyruvate dehydrogenase (quinone)/pyruvate oxidase
MYDLGIGPEITTRALYRVRPYVLLPAEHRLATPGPVLVQAVVDGFEPPMPAKLTLEQAARFAVSLARGEPNREQIALTVLRDRIRELV